ncbi:PIG-L family deacetylase [Aureimonas sp. AU40]|uniref:PIG-L family deacetylase n=1 Tax=Aureimonas sp. AU40 TaxID=1637747 RepID=UPI000783454E|nr:PIG-L family deacetylase [Aureimonas sp. AU40]
MSRYGDWCARHDAAPVVDPLLLTGPGGLVVIAPHPDDEALGASGLLVAMAHAGRPVGLVALTDGEGSHRQSAEWPAERLAARRREEQAMAMAELGCEDAPILHLSLPDGASRWHDDFAGTAKRVAAFCDEIGATALASTVPFDPHPDHEAAAILAENVHRLRPRLRRLSYPVWSMRHPAELDVDVDGLTPFRVETPIVEKARAIARHETQMGSVVGDDPSGFALPDWFLRHHQGPFECVFWHRMPGSPPGPEHFAALYDGDRDPWGARDSAYELEKREALLRFLGEEGGDSAIEFGCGEGHVAGALASRFRTVAGFDLDPGIVARATAHHGAPGRVTFQVGRMPEAFPDLRFDLLVLSEMLYFLTEAEIEALMARACHHARPGARLVLVNYLGPTDTPLSGDDAADFLLMIASEKLTLERAERTERYRMDLLRFRAPDSEA